jgi:archaellum component FlaC
MEAMRESWTDERLDDFRAETARRLDKIDTRFDRIDERFEKVDERFEKVDERFERVDARFERLEAKLDKKFERIDARFDDLFRTMIFLGGGVIVTFVVGFAGLIVAG